MFKQRLGFTVIDALKVMVDKNFGPVVLHKNGKFIGLKKIALPAFDKK
jgi:hypothetical protein